MFTHGIVSKPIKDREKGTRINTKEAVHKRFSNNWSWGSHLKHLQMSRQSPHQAARWQVEGAESLEQEGLEVQTTS